MKTVVPNALVAGESHICTGSVVMRFRTFKTRMETQEAAPILIFT